MDLNKISKKVKVLIGILLTALLGTVCTFVSISVKHYVGLLIDEKVDARVKVQMKDRDVIEEFLGGQLIQDFASEKGDSLIAKIELLIIKRDTNKVGMRIIIAKEANIYPTTVPFDLGKVLKDYNAGIFVTKAYCDANSRGTRRMIRN